MRARVTSRSSTVSLGDLNSNRLSCRELLGSIRHFSCGRDRGIARRWRVDNYDSAGQHMSVHRFAHGFSRSGIGLADAVRD
jgi:hypothetical protein